MNDSMNASIEPTIADAFVCEMFHRWDGRKHHCEPHYEDNDEIDTECVLKDECTWYNGRPWCKLVAQTFTTYEDAVCSGAPMGKAKDARIQLIETRARLDAMCDRDYERTQALIEMEKRLEKARQGNQYWRGCNKELTRERDELAARCEDNLRLIGVLKEIVAILGIGENDSIQQAVVRVLGERDNYRALCDNHGLSVTGLGW